MCPVCFSCSKTRNAPSVSGSVFSDAVEEMRMGPVHLGDALDV